MASRKQRRRRQKERRHEYEFVYVDDEGREVDVDDAESQRSNSRPERRDGKRDSRRPQGKGAVRKVDPPSWGRVARRAMILAPAVFLALSLLSHKEPLATRVAVTAFYTAVFIPFMYLLDRAMYRTYLRRTGQAPAEPAGRRH